MEKDAGKKAGIKKPASREDRLKVALRTNLQRRKAQAKARSKPGKA